MHPHQGKLDPDPDPHPHQSYSLDPDLDAHQFADEKLKCMECESI
jgi:hypothetical protein